MGLDAVVCPKVGNIPGSADLLKSLPDHTDEYLRVDFLSGLGSIRKIHIVLFSFLVFLGGCQKQKRASAEDADSRTLRPTAACGQTSIPRTIHLSPVPMRRSSPRRSRLRQDRCLRSTCPRPLSEPRVIITSASGLMVVSVSTTEGTPIARTRRDWEFVPT